MNIEDVLKQYDLAFETKLVPIYFKEDNKDFDIDYSKAVIRTDKNIALGVVGDKYKIVNLKDALAPFQSFIDSSEISPSKIYSQRYGARVSCCFKVNDLITDIDNCVFNCEFAVRLSYDGSSKVTLAILARSQHGTVYPVSGEFSLAVRHTKNADSKLAALDKVLTRIKLEWKEFDAFARTGAALPMGLDEAKEFVKFNTGITDETKQGEAQLEAIFKRWQNCIIPSMRNTIFGLYLGICDWAQLDKPVRSTKKRNVDPVTDLDLRIIKMLDNRNIYKTWAGMKAIEMMGSNL